MTYFGICFILYNAIYSTISKGHASVATSARFNCLRKYRRFAALAVISSTRLIYFKYLLIVTPRTLVLRTAPREGKSPVGKGVNSDRLKMPYARNDEASQLKISYVYYYYVI